MSPEILRALNERPIAYYPIYRRITGSVTSAVMLSQLMYWFASSKADKVYKTDTEIMEETLLSERELRSAKSTIKSLPFITVTREGLPARTYYAIDWGLFEEAVLAVSSSELDLTNRPNCTGRIVRTVRDESSDLTITETTTETTAERPRKRGSRLPADWTLPPEWRAWALDNQPTWTPEHCQQIAETFRDYWISVPGQRGTKLDWFATWRNWVRKEGPMRSRGSGKMTPDERRAHNQRVFNEWLAEEDGGGVTIDGEAEAI